MPAYDGLVAEPIPVACTLTTKDAAAQVLEWADLRKELVGVERVERGVEMRFPVALADAVRDLADREASCCAFLDLTATERNGELELRIASDADEAGPVIDLLAGLGGGPPA